MAVFPRGNRAVPECVPLDVPGKVAISNCGAARWPFVNSERAMATPALAAGLRGIEDSDELT